MIAITVQWTFSCLLHKDMANFVYFELLLEKQKLFQQMMKTPSNSRDEQHN